MSRSRLLLVIAGLIAVVGVGGFIVYDQVLRGDSAAALTLPAASSAPAASAAEGTSATSAPGSSAAPGSSDAAAARTGGSVAGNWSVGSGSQAGYRVREQLGNLPAQSDAVGRTDKVTGSITIATSGATTTVTAGSLTVDTTSISSDKNQRDNRLRSEGLQTDSFPTATFTLTKPVDVPAAALSGTASDVTLTGDLTLHGVTKSVTIPAKAQLVNGTIQVAGSIAFPLSDYQIVAPNLGGIIVSIADTGTLEFIASFTKA